MHAHSLPSPGEAGAVLTERPRERPLGPKPWPSVGKAVSLAEPGSVRPPLRVLPVGVMEGEAWGRACAGATSFWGGFSIRSAKPGPFSRTLYGVCSKSGVTDHTLGAQENTECQSRKGTYSVHSSPLMVHTGILRPMEGAQLVLVMQLGSGNPGSLPLQACNPGGFLRRGPRG